MLIIDSISTCTLMCYFLCYDHTCGLRAILEFFLNVSLNSANSETKIFVITEKGLEPATSCVRDQDATHVKDGNFIKTQFRFQ